MTELESTAGGPVDEAAGWTEVSDAPVAQVRELFVVLAKAFRAYQLYDENNPVRHRFVESLRQAIEAFWTELDHLTLAVDEDHIFLAGQEVYKAESRSDSLAFLFFKDGVREITFLPGIEDEELVRFLGVLQRARKLVPEGDDLLTVLWEEDLQHFQYQYVDFLAEGVELPEPGAGATAQQMQGVLGGELAEEEEEEAPALRHCAGGRSGPDLHRLPRGLQSDALLARPARDGDVADGAAQGAAPGPAR